MRRKKTRLFNRGKLWYTKHVPFLLTTLRQKHQHTIAQHKGYARVVSVSPFHRAGMAIFGVVFFFSLVLPIGVNRQASAFSTYSQSDWSGGVGSGANQYSAVNNINASGSLTLGSTTNSWCNTTSCNTNWTRRQALKFDYAGAGSTGNYLVALSIPYKASMQSDFDDLRFTAANNTTELKYYMESKTNGSSAYVYVEIGSVAADSIHTIYMYYGNAGATSTSDDSIMLLTDQFEARSTTNTLITEWASPGSGTNQLNAPKEIATDSSNNVYVADALNHRIVKYDSSGTQLLTFGTEGNSDGQFRDPYGIAFNASNGNIYVTDQIRNDVQVFNTSGVFQSKFGSTGSGNGQLSNPTGITICNGKIGVVDNGNSRFTLWNSGGTWATASGSNGSAFGQLDDPRGVASYYNSGIGGCAYYIADRGNNRVVFAADDGGMVPGNLVPQQLGSGTAGSGLDQLSQPNSITRDANGNFYVADEGNDRVMMFNPKAKHVAHWSTGATAVTVSGDGKVYTANFQDSKVQKYGPAGMNPAFNSLGTDDYTVNGNELTITNTALQTPSNWTRTAPRTIEFDFKVDLTAANCDEYARTFRHIQGSGSTATAVIFERNACDDIGNGKYHKLNYVVNDNQALALPSDVSNLKIRDGQYVRVRVIAQEGQGYRYMLSSDDGASFIDLTSSTLGSNADNVGLNFQAFTSKAIFKNIAVYDGANYPPTHSYGSEEFVGGKSGTVESAVIDLGAAYTLYGTISANTTGTGTVDFYARTSTDGNFSSNYYFCGRLSSGGNITDSSCAANSRRYIQYLAVLNEPSAGNLSVTSIDFEYTSDAGAPDVNASNIIIKKSSSGDTITNGSWTNDTTPYFSWTAGQDDVNGVGLAGYCVYLGQSSSGDPAGDKGLISDSSPVDTGGACPYAVSGLELDVASINLSANLSNGNTYYIAIKAIDQLGQIYAGDAATASLKIDLDEPEGGTIFTLPSGFINTKQFTVSWPYIEGVPSFGDGYSGVAGVKYCLTNILIGNSGCGPTDNNWYGKAHTSGRIDDVTDVIPFSDASFTTVAADAARLDDDIVGANFISVVVIDNAGNPANVSLPFGGLVLITQHPPTAPQNLAVSPSSNSSNAFSFTWDVPSTYSGAEADIDYCWTVNQAIAADGSNCTWTSKGFTQLASGPFATTQGTNTLYLMARDQSSNFSSDNVASVTFTASTVAPGPPQDTEISDVSTRATSTWKLALSWSAPAQVGAGISSYKVYRSTDNATFTQVGSTSNSNLSFIDSGLSQQTYYYHIKACDSANACSVAGNVVSKLPTGRYTTPPSLTADSNQPRAESVGTKKATILWFTDRSGDSKVAFGTAPGQYGAAEIGSSNQVTDHSVTLTNLQPGTTYYYVAKWTDQDGNTGASQERSFRTADAPGVKNAEARSVRVSSADIVVTVKNSTSLKMLYGPNEGFGLSKTIATAFAESEYTLFIDGLRDEQRYVYKFVLTDQDGNEFSSDVYSFTTPPRPRIINLQFQPVEGSPSSTQKITWQTNVPANSTISYGRRGERQLDELKSQFELSHEITVTGLEDDSDYTLLARSTDAAGNTAVSDLQTFRTALDTRPPKISDITVEASIRGNGPEAKGQVVVSWRTDEKATSQVAFAQGQTQQLTNNTQDDTKLTTEHTVVVSGLSPASLYSIQPVSRDKSANTTKGEIQTAIIGRPSDNVFTIIYNALRGIFGLK